jgi:hypothetical protein
MLLGRPGALRNADRESDYPAPISEANDGSLMEVGRKFRFGTVISLLLSRAEVAQW